MTDDEARAIARAVVDEAFLRLGVDASTPEAITQMQADFAFVRRQRKAGEALKENAVRTLWYAAGVVLVGLLSFIATSFGWKSHL